jgi:hypothetical protein
MKKYFLYFLFISALLACNNNAEISIPDSVISKEKMAAVLLDIHLAEANMNLSVNPQSIQPKSNSLNIDILKKHGLNKKTFDESFQFYSENPALLNEIYQQVLNDLSKLQAQVMNEK